MQARGTPCKLMELYVCPALSWIESWRGRPFSIVRYPYIIKKSEKFNLAFLQRWQTVHTWKFSTAVLVISIVKILVVAFTVLITAHAQFLADRHLTAMQWCVQAVLWCTHCTAVDNAAIYTKTTDFQLPLRFHKCAITGMLTVKDLQIFLHQWSNIRSGTCKAHNQL